MGFLLAAVKIGAFKNTTGGVPQSSESSGLIS